MTLLSLKQKQHLLPKTALSCTLTAAGGFPLGTISSTQATAENFGNAKPLVVIAQTTASDLSFGNSSTTRTTDWLREMSLGINPSTAYQLLMPLVATRQLLVLLLAMQQLLILLVALLLQLMVAM